MQNRNNRKKVMIAAAILLGLAIVGGVFLRGTGERQVSTIDADQAPTADASVVSGNGTATVNGAEFAKDPWDKSTEESATHGTPSNGAVGNTEKSVSAAQNAKAGGLAGLKAKVFSLFGGGNGGLPNSNDLGSAAPGDAALAKSEPKEPVIDVSKNCFTENFSQKSNLSIEALANRRNLLRLKYAAVNPKSVCVRVNGTPVAYQIRPSVDAGKVDEILLGPVAAPTAKITVRYCMVKTTCNEECNVPKDEFLEAIGGVADAAEIEGGKAVKWDPEEQGGEDDVTAGLDPEVKRELASHGDLKVFNGWLSEGAEVSCGTKPLPKPVAGSASTQPQG